MQSVEPTTNILHYVVSNNSIKTEQISDILDTHEKIIVTGDN